MRRARSTISSAMGRSASPRTSSKGGLRIHGVARAPLGLPGPFGTAERRALRGGTPGGRALTIGFIHDELLHPRTGNPRGRVLACGAWCGPECDAGSRMLPGTAWDSMTVGPEGLPKPGVRHRSKTKNPKRRSSGSLGINWRKGWDSNPRYGITVYRISSPAHSTSLPPFRVERRRTIQRPPGKSKKRRGEKSFGAPLLTREEAPPGALFPGRPHVGYFASGRSTSRPPM